VSLVDDRDALWKAIAAGDPAIAVAADASPLEPVWDHSVEPLERALEIAVVYLAMYTGRDVLTLVLAMAERAFAIAAPRAGDDGATFFAASPRSPADGGSVEGQLAAVRTWLATRSDADADRVAEAVDPARQLNIWDDDMYPDPDGMWMWLLEVGQLLAMACVEPAEWGDGRPEEAWSWPWHVLGARAAVCALKAVRTPDSDIAADLASLAGAS
jgi:hypothetical protein